jgi:hypothetical protein
MPIIGNYRQSPVDVNQQRLLIINAYKESITEILAKKEPNYLALSTLLNNLVVECGLAQKQIADAIGKTEPWTCQVRRLNKTSKNTAKVLLIERKHLFSE